MQRHVHGFAFHFCSTSTSDLAFWWEVFSKYKKLATYSELSNFYMSKNFQSCIAPQLCSTEVCLMGELPFLANADHYILEMMLTASRYLAEHCSFCTRRPSTLCPARRGPWQHQRPQWWRCWRGRATSHTTCLGCVDRRYIIHLICLQLYLW